jgi:DNA-binding XRE family transcriptional regulator
MLQSDLAKILDVCEDSITGWEVGRYGPQIQFYPRIIQFLGYNPFSIDASTLGGRIKKYRFENGLSQEKLATQLGIDESTICHWEKNEHKPVREKLKLLESVIK